MIRAYKGHNREGNQKKILKKMKETALVSKGWFSLPISITKNGHRSDFKLDNQPPKLAKCLHTNMFFFYTTVLYFSKLEACAETISTWFVVLFTISRYLIFKSATDPISIENSPSVEIGQVTNFRGLKSDRWQISVMEIGSLNGP